MDSLTVPPFEYETKKTLTSTPKTPKSAAAPSLAETSVAPRQRPKACQLNPSTNFPLGLPPSPSPRNILSSPIPADSQQPPFKTQTSKTPENFNAQFEVDFSNIDDSIAPAPMPIQQPPVTQLPSQPQPIQGPPAALSQTPEKTVIHHKEDAENLDNLFKSDYPDPFREQEQNDCGEIAEIQANLNKTDVLAENPATQQLFNSKIGHRRNVSDTSTFKR